MTSAEFAEIIAYMRVESIGERRKDLRAALHCLRVCLSNGAKIDDVNEFVNNFMPDFWKPEPTEQELIDKTMQYFERMRILANGK